MKGDSNDNSFDGRSGNDVINTRGGNDSIIQSSGNDSVDGGEGDDVFFAQSGSAIAPESNGGFNLTKDGSLSSISNVESIMLNSADDSFDLNGIVNVDINGSGGENTLNIVSSRSNVDLVEAKKIQKETTNAERLAQLMRTGLRVR
mgnify:CR=1 FL=1